MTRINTHDSATCVGSVETDLGPMPCPDCLRRDEQRLFPPTRQLSVDERAVALLVVAGIAVALGIAAVSRRDKTTRQAPRTP